MNKKMMALTLGALSFTACDNGSKEFAQYAQTQNEQAQVVQANQLKQLEALQAYKLEVETLKGELASVRQDIKSLSTKSAKNTSVEAAADSALKIAALTDPAIKKTACTLMGLIGGDECEAELIKLYRSSRSSDVNSEALKALRVMKSTKVKPVVLEVATSTNTSKKLRRYSCEALTELADDTMTTKLIK